MFGCANMTRPLPPPPPPPPPPPSGMLPFLLCWGCRQPWFAGIDWAAVHSKSLTAPIIPSGLDQV